MALVIVKKIRYNKHCNWVVILNLELVQFWLFLAAFGTPLTGSFLINKKKTHKTFISITVNIYDIISFEELSFQSTLIKNYFYLLIFTCPRTSQLGKSTCPAGSMYESGMAIPHPCVCFVTFDCLGVKGIIKYIYNVQDIQNNSNFAG